MAKNDVVVRTAQDLERKYNFASLLGLKKNVEITAQGIQKIENELNSMLNALVINLKDVLDSQGEISLWFYSGRPTKENPPYTDWSNPAEHEGDIYYDQASGVVYQLKNGAWGVNTSPDLVEAMAITNAEIDTSKDHERKVFFDTPSIPYSSGDWWIKEDGSLFICQISKTSGVYEDDDFINSNKYVSGTIAEKLGEELKVLKGTVTTISENYAKFTDLETGGSTTIAGENISTGNIQSNNYVSGVSGMKIALADGQIDSKNLKLDENGDLTIGGYIRTDNGILTNLQFTSASGDTPLGWYYDGAYHNMAININYSIPANFKIEKAFITLYHIPAYTSTGEIGLKYWGWSRAVKAYKLQNENLYLDKMGLVMIPYYGELTNVDEIPEAFGDGWTANEANTYTHDAQTVNSGDFASKLSTGESGMLIIKTTEAIPADGIEAVQETGHAFATLNVIGYMAYE